MAKVPQTESDMKEKLVIYQHINKLQAVNLINNADRNR